MTFAFFDIALRLGMGILALFTTTYALRYYDRSSGRPFRQSFEIMKGEPRALATYYGARFIGVCLLIAVVLA